MSLVTVQVPGAGLTGQGDTLYVCLSCPPWRTPAHSLVTPGLTHTLLIMSHHVLSHLAVCVVSTGPGAGISAVSSPAGVPLRAVQIMVTVARAPGASMVTVPVKIGVSFGPFSI